MVLVSYILENSTSILQTKFSYGERHEARRVRPETMPLDQHIESGHGERQARLKIRPAPMHHLLQMADERQHREHRLHQRAVLPLAALTHVEIARIALRGMEAQTPPTPVLRLCIIKPTGLPRPSREWYRCF